MKISHTNIARFFALIICLTLAYACGGKGNNAHKKDTSKNPASSGEEALRFVVELDSSYVSWVGSSVTDRHYGQIGFSEGIFFVEKNMLSSGSATIDIGQLRVAHPEDRESAEKLRTHLLSADFFEAERYPTAYFECVAIAPYDSSAFRQHTEEYDSLNKPADVSSHRTHAPTHNITANLSIRGTKRTVIFPARVLIDRDSLVIEAKFDIDRTAFGITYREEASVVDKLKDKFIYNTVNVGVFLQAKFEKDTSAVQLDKAP